MNPKASLGDKYGGTYLWFRRAAVCDTGAWGLACVTWVGALACWVSWAGGFACVSWLGGFACVSRAGALASGALASGALAMARVIWSRLALMSSTDFTLSPVACWWASLRSVTAWASPAILRSTFRISSANSGGTGAG